MKGLALKNPLSGDRRLYAALLCVILLGVFFRFYRIDHRLFWQDEVYAVYRASGYTEYDLSREIPNGKVHSFKILEKYLHPAQHSKGLLAVIKTAWEYPHIPPLYESLLWCWIQIFGDSITTVRSFSAFLSLFAFPLVIWLCWELFRSYKVGWIAAALIAVSPYQVIYSQEARNYSIWCVAILLSSAALMRALRLKNFVAWALYAVSFVLGLYSHLFFIYVAAAHIIYVLLCGRESIKKFMLSGLGAGILFLPQLFLIALSFQQIIITQTWTARSVPRDVLLRTFLDGLTQLFFEPLTFSTFRSIVNFSLVPLLLGIFFYSLLKEAPRRSCLFMVLVGSVSFLSLLIPDLLSGGVRISATRYLLPFFLMIQLTGAFFFYACVTAQVAAKKLLGYSLLFLLISAGAISCYQNSKALTLNFSASEYKYRQLAKYLDSNEGSLVVRVVKLFNLRHFLTTSCYLESHEKSYFEQLPIGESIFIDYASYNKKLLVFSTVIFSPKEVRKWVEASGEFKLAPVGPKNWQTGQQRIYEIKKV